jgi:hypothetical protein
MLSGAQLSHGVRLAEKQVLSPGAQGCEALCRGIGLQG